MWFIGMSNQKISWFFGNVFRRTTSWKNSIISSEVRVTLFSSYAVSFLATCDIDFGFSGTNHVVCGTECRHEHAVTFSLYTTWYLCWRGGPFASKRCVVARYRRLFCPVSEKSLFRMDPSWRQVCFFGESFCRKVLLFSTWPQTEELL